MGGRVPDLDELKDLKIHPSFSQSVWSEPRIMLPQILSGDIVDEPRLIWSRSCAFFRGGLQVALGWDRPCLILLSFDMRTACICHLDYNR